MDEFECAPPRAHLTNEEILAKLYSIRDNCLTVIERAAAKNAWSGDKWTGVGAAQRVFRECLQDIATLQDRMSGQSVIEGEVRYRLIGYQEPEGESDEVDEDAAE